MSGEFISKVKQFMVDQIKETTVAHATQNSLSKKDLLKIGTSGALAVFLAACQTLGDRVTPTVNPGVTPTPETAPTIAPETKVTSGELSMITDQAKRQEIISSLPKDRPDAEGGDQNIETFKINAGGTDFNFAMYNLTQDEIANGVVIETTDANGKKTDIVQSVALYSQIVDYSGKASWTRLIGIDVPQTDPSGKTEHGIIWVYDTKGFPKPPNLPVIGTDPSGKSIVDTSKAPTVDLSRPVLAYVVPPQSPNKISFAPLTSEPSQMVKFDTPKPLDIKVGESSPNEIQISPVVFKFTSENTGAPVSAVTTETPTPEKTYQICQIENFRNCVIPPEDLLGGKDSPYLRWLKSISRPFDTTNIKQVPLISNGMEIIYDINTAPNFKGISTTGNSSGADFRRGVTTGITTYEGHDYLVLPTEYYDKDHPDNNVWVIDTVPLFYIKDGIYKDAPRGADASMIQYWKDEQKVNPIYTSDVDPYSNFIIPLVAKSFADNPDMQQRFADFPSRRSALDGIIVSTDIADAGSWYK